MILFEMKKTGLFLIIIVACFVFIFLAICYKGARISEVADFLEKNASSLEENANDSTDENKPIENPAEDIVTEISQENNGGGASGKAVNPSGNNEEKSGLQACMLERPGNLPNIACSVNYIAEEEVSLRIKNELGEKINVEIQLNSCSPTLSGEIENNGFEDFTFLCKNEKGNFVQDLLITYSLGEGKIIIGGFVSGIVS